LWPQVGGNKGIEKSPPPIFVRSSFNAKKRQKETNAWLFFFLPSSDNICIYEKNSIFSGKISFDLEKELGVVIYHNLSQNLLVLSNI